MQATAAAPQTTPEVSLSWKTAFQDLPREHSFEPLRVEGRIPDDLTGTLYRNGPAIFSRFGTRYPHWFDGDGAVSAVRFAGGKAMGAVKLVQSQAYLQEEKARRSLSSGYGTRAPGNLVTRFRAPQKNAANTSVMMWNGKLYALFEGGNPTELSPEDLSTIGESNLGGIVQQTFSAHPHRIPSRKATYNFGVRYGRDTLLDIFELKDGGAGKLLTHVALPGPTMVHDFITTQNHLVFFVSPLRMSVLPMLLRQKAFSDCLAWKPEVGTEVIVIPVDNPTSVTRFNAEPFYQWHYSNAFERDGNIVVDFVRYADFSSNVSLGRIVNGEEPEGLNGTLHRAVLDMNAKRLAAERIWDVPCEFPRVAPSVTTSNYQYAYVAFAPKPGVANSLARVDVSNGDAAVSSLDRGQYPSEPIFVPRSDAAKESDGYLLTLVYDAGSHTSHIAILDATQLGNGPIARAHFDHHIPLTFHGGFAPSRAQ